LSPPPRRGLLVRDRAHINQEQAVKYRLRFVGIGASEIIPDREYDSPPMVPGLGDDVDTQDREDRTRVIARWYVYEDDAQTVVLTLVPPPPATPETRAGGRSTCEGSPYDPTPDRLNHA